MEFGETLRKYRKKNHMTQEQLAELLEVSTQNISCWERNVYSPSMDKVNRIAKVLNVSVGQLMDTEVITEIQWELRDQMFSTDNLYEHVRNQIINYNFMQSKQALPLMMHLHKNQTRKGNGRVAYVSHPLMMAFQALALGIMEDDVITVILLHGVRRNCGMKPEELNIALNDSVTHA